MRFRTVEEAIVTAVFALVGIATLTGALASAPFGIGLALFGDSGSAIVSIVGGGLRVVAASFAALASALLYYDLVVRSEAAPAAEPSAATPGSGA